MYCTCMAGVWLAHLQIGLREDSECLSWALVPHSWTQGSQPSVLAQLQAPAAAAVASQRLPHQACCHLYNPETFRRVACRA